MSLHMQMASGVDWCLLLQFIISVPAWSCFQEFFPVTVILIRGSWQACWSSSWTETVWKAPAPGPGPGPGALSWTGGPQIRSSLSVSAHPIWTTRGNTLLSADCDVRSHRMHDPATVAGRGGLNQHGERETQRMTDPPERACRATLPCWPAAASSRRWSLSATHRRSRSSRSRAPACK